MIGNPKYFLSWITTLTCGCIHNVRYILVEESLFILLYLNYNSRFPKETGVDQARRHCSVEMIRGTGPSELGWSRPMSKNPLERAWPQWDQRRLSNRREQILHFDLSRKGREAITIHTNTRFFSPYRPYTFHVHMKERTL